MNWKIALRRRGPRPADASATKVYGSELATEVYRSLMEIVGPNAVRHRRLPRRRRSRGRLERYYRSSLVMTFGGGTNEIQRDIIGMVGLGLPPREALRSRPDDHGLHPHPRPGRRRRAGRPDPRRPVHPRAAGQVEAGGDRFDRELWRELGEAGLLGLALPEEYGGAGLGLLELYRVLVEVGRKGRAGPAGRARAAPPRRWPSSAPTSSAGAGCPAPSPASAC